MGGEGENEIKGGKGMEKENRKGRKEKQRDHFC
jgi:hypothetical protein